MNVIKKAFSATQEFVEDHKVAIAIGVATVATATACMLIQRSAIKDWNNFLETEGLIEKFYTPIG